MLKGLLRLLGLGPVLQFLIGREVLSKVADELRAFGDPAPRKPPAFSDKQDELDWANREGRRKEERPPTGAAVSVTGMNLSRIGPKVIPTPRAKRGISGDRPDCERADDPRATYAAPAGDCRPHGEG